MGYASLPDLYRYGAPATAFGAISAADQQAALDEASKQVDSYLRARYALPLIAWDTSITKYACRIATYELISARGYAPQAGSDDTVEMRYNAAITELTLIQKQQMHPDVTPQPAQTPTYNQPTVISTSVAGLSSGATLPNRGW